MVPAVLISSAKDAASIKVFDLPSVRGFIDSIEILAFWYVLLLFKTISAMAAVKIWPVDPQEIVP